MRRLLGLALVAALAACSDDGADSVDSPTETACSKWRELLLEDPAPSDAEVASRLRAIDLEGVDQDVAGTVTALAARLEDGTDISTSYERLSSLCT